MLTRAVLQLKGAFGAGGDEAAGMAHPALTVGQSQIPQPLVQPKENITTHLPANTLKHHSTPLQQRRIFFYYYFFFS